MGKITINVAGKESVDLMCLKCGNSRQVSIASLPPGDNMYRIKCKCGEAYSVAFDRRRFIRRKTDLRGVYFTESRMKDELIEISNVSMTGLCFVKNDKCDLRMGQIITLNFVLDNVNKDTVECKAIIRQIQGERIGVEFMNLSPGAQRTIGFYLFNYIDKEDS